MDKYEVLKDDSQSFEIRKKDDYIERYRFLYDVTMANARGQKIYKKAEITV